jgi:hypothetical protein
MIRKARAVWRGSGRAGNGDLSDGFKCYVWLTASVLLASFHLGPQAQGKELDVEYPTFYRTIQVDGVDQRAYLEGKSAKSARDTFFYYGPDSLGGAVQELEAVLLDGRKLRELRARRRRNL